MRVYGDGTTPRTWDFDIRMTVQSIRRCLGRRGLERVRDGGQPPGYLYEEVALRANPPSARLTQPPPRVFQGVMVNRG